jgi:hypothetical protein
MGRVHVFSSGLEAEDCFSRNEIRSEPLLSGACFGIFIDVPLIYDAFILIIIIIIYFPLKNYD